MPAAAIASGFAKGGVDKPLDPEKMIKMRENAVNALLKQNRTMPTQEEVDQYMNLVNPKSLAAASSTASSPKDNTQPAIDVKKERRKINKGDENFIERTDKSGKKTRYTYDENGKTIEMTEGENGAWIPKNQNYGYDTMEDKTKQENLPEYLNRS